MPGTPRSARGRRGVVASVWRPCAATVTAAVPVLRPCTPHSSLRDLTRVDEQAPGNVLSVDPGISDEQYASWFPGNEQGYSPFQNKNPDPGIE